ncbi:polysaccharide biosynthesis protein [Candidatus Saccharibacteria bacterium]|nr:polysaccharide biosynthesis protein [Candidatus Saccharibacteria bacterium]
MKICLISSSGGHFEQLLMLQKLSEHNHIFIVTEKTAYNKHDKKINYYISQVNRKEFLFLPKMLGIFFKSLFIFVKERPDVIISTGVLSTIPMLFLGHVFKKKVIYIESFAKINDPTMTGKLVYKKNWANQFYVQWKSMQKFYPNAIYAGGIY